MTSQGQSVSSQITTWFETAQLPALFQRLGTNSAHLEALWEQYATVMQLPEIARRTKELMGFAVSVAKPCDYMLAFQRARLRQVGVSADEEQEALAVCSFFEGFDAFAHALRVDSDLRPRQMLAGDMSRVDQEVDVNVPYVLAPEDDVAASVYADIRRSMGIPFVPNIFKALAHQPAALQAKWNAYRAIMLRGKLRRLPKELIAVTVSAIHGCFY